MNKWYRWMLIGWLSACGHASVSVAPKKSPPTQGQPSPVDTTPTTTPVIAHPNPPGEAPPVQSKISIAANLPVTLGEGFAGTFDVTSSDGSFTGISCVAIANVAITDVRQVRAMGGIGALGVTDLTSSQLASNLPMQVPESEIFVSVAVENPSHLVSVRGVSVTGTRFATEQVHQTGASANCGNGFVTALTASRHLAWALSLDFSNPDEATEFVRQFGYPGTNALLVNDHTDAMGQFLLNKATLSFTVFQAGGDTDATSNIVTQSQCSLTKLTACRQMIAALDDVLLHFADSHDPSSLATLGNDWGIFSYQIADYASAH